MKPRFLWDAQDVADYEDGKKGSTRRDPERVSRWVIRYDPTTKEPIYAVCKGADFFALGALEAKKHDNPR